MQMVTNKRSQIRSGAFRFGKKLSHRQKKYTQREPNKKVKHIQEYLTMKRPSTGGQKRGEEEDTNFASGESVDHILRISHDKNHGRDDAQRQHRLPRHRDSASL